MCESLQKSRNSQLTQNTIQFNRKLQLPWISAYSAIMKFRTFALAAALLAPQVNSQTVTNGNFTFVGSYETASTLGGFLGGGSIVDDTLLLIVNSEFSGSSMASVPILRNATTGRINGFDFASADQTFFVEPYMDMMTQQPNFVGGKYIYSSTDDCHDPKTMSFADPAFTDVTKIESIRDLGITDDLGSGEIFKGAYGVDFSPVITDPGTGNGKLMCTSINSFWEVGLSQNASEWEISGASKLADLDAYYAGGFSFIPSGSNKDNIFFADWDNDIVKMMEFDVDGRPAPGPITTDFITGIKAPWGFFFDDKTKDFFVTTWDAPVDGIVHFKGFPPGLDVDVVIANIQNQMQVALSILISGRRKLEDDEPKRQRLRKPESKKKKSSKTGKSKGDDGETEVEIPTADEIVGDILSSGTAADATAVFTDLLDATFSNDSFTNDVISGGSSEAFEENIGKFSDSVDLLLTAADSAALDTTELETVQDSLNTVNELVALLASVTEGSQF